MQLCSSGMSIREIAVTFHAEKEFYSSKPLRSVIHFQCFWKEHLVWLYLLMVGNCIAGFDWEKDWISLLRAHTSEKRFDFWRRQTLRSGATQNHLPTSKRGVRLEKGVTLGLLPNSCEVNKQLHLSRIHSHCCWLRYVDSRTSQCIDVFGGRRAIIQLMIFAKQRDFWVIFCPMTQITAFTCVCCWSWTTPFGDRRASLTLIRIANEDVTRSRVNRKQFLTRVRLCFQWLQQLPILCTDMWRFIGCWSCLQFGMRNACVRSPPAAAVPAYLCRRRPVRAPRVRAGNRRRRFPTCRDELRVDRPTDGRTMWNMAARCFCRNRACHTADYHSAVHGVDASYGRCTHVTYTPTHDSLHSQIGRTGTRRSCVEWNHRWRRPDPVYDRTGAPPGGDKACDNTHTRTHITVDEPVLFTFSFFRFVIDVRNANTLQKIRQIEAPKKRFGFASSLKFFSWNRRPINFSVEDMACR